MRSSATAIALLAAACGGSVSGAEIPPPPLTTCPIATVPAAPTFVGDILPMLQQSCGSATATCHGGAAPRGHVSYATDQTRTAADVRGALVNAVPANAPIGKGWLLVAPNDAAHSWIVEKVTVDEPGGIPGGAYGARMPYAAPNLCPATVQAIQAWIGRGAP